jgi:DNA-binding XRE family transcriptional regulator
MIIKRSNPSSTSTTTTETRGPAIAVELFAVPDPEVQHPNSKPVEHYIAERELIPTKAASLERARQRLAEGAGVPEDLRTLRLRSGLSRKKLGELVGTSQASIARIESGQEDPSLGLARRFASSLQVDMDTLAASLSRRSGHRF